LARFPFRFPTDEKKKKILGFIPRVNLPDLVIRKLLNKNPWVQHLGQLKVLDDDNTN
jgi:hypothetical protein